MVTLVNRAKVATASVGTGTITLGAAESGYQSFADAGVANSDVVRYVIEDGDAWEIGTGTYTASGTTLSRTVSESSNADAALNLTGAAVVYVSATAADIPPVSYVRKIANYTAAAGENIIADTSGGAWTLTLPATPSSGDALKVADGADWSANNLTVGRNGSTIEGDAADMTMDIGGVSVSFVYDGTTWQIYAQVGASGDAVTLTGAQTLTNKTLTAPAISSPAITGTIVEDVYALSGTTPALDPDNGSVQTWTLSGNSTPTDSLASGEAITVMVDDGTAYTVTWPTTTWVNNGGIAPTLATTGYTVVALWKVSTTLYGALVGDGT